ncbi:hypothetical protein LB534_00065 [Mesorhizobium sp. CA18]|uniref:hypothetical protein n=1 Tax=unclassified Mesorhizobium TaxID=325217 RepID=UPI001CCD2103|nr:MULTISPECIES: hypothetical protein [unclassified Mesorhizobium]MBZ9737381.1 hypothetical protein [Mesorhizobium sp. CA9]MBZ9823667.1 hypothetical protein [Mesorhizobium sp. CA18]MBZ9834954.1 hypothetical protein [Mesorhizobium sp. CA2]MBZ9836782.1 hypothetical protein [Mesorhizobium sp. CA3]MBZ9875309.1 hypothetical protein [Mesorhizobium sp. Ca11]
MTTTDMILLAGALWVGGGLLFIQGIVTNCDAGPAVSANSRAVVEDLRRGRPAALVAAALFLAVWPAVWVGAHLVRR